MAAMPDVLGHRAKLGVLVPSTNTVVEADFWAMAPPGVTLQTARIFVEDTRTDTDHALEKLIAQVDRAIERAVRDVLTAEPDGVIVGMSSESIWEGREASHAFRRRVEALSRVRVTTGGDAAVRALSRLGARTVSVVTPYQPVGDTRVRAFLEECGFTVMAVKGLRCANAVTIAHVAPAALRQAIGEVDGAGVDAILQMGTNLSMLRLADEAERELGKPVIAINAATLWSALREHGIADRRPGFGCLLREH